MSTRGKRLRMAMRARCVRKQQALAFQLGVHESAITRWKEDGSLSLTNAIALCNALDISLDWLLLGRGTIDSHKLRIELSHPEESQLMSSFNELSQQLTEPTRARLQAFITSLHMDLLGSARGLDCSTRK
jgi:transcriptional regulator with XRE-family HTH domain